MSDQEISKNLYRGCKGKGHIRQGRVCAKEQPGTDKENHLNGVEGGAPGTMGQQCVLAPGREVKIELKAK